MAIHPVPRKLYKYRPFDVFFLRILTHAEVSYSDPRKFNDPLDCDPTIEVDIELNDLEHLCYEFLRSTLTDDEAKAEIKNYRYRSSEHGDFRSDPSVEAYLKSLLAERIRERLKQELGSQGVLSLSARWDSSLMWSHYADNHKGICIEFDATALSHPNLGAVDYLAPRRIRASDLFDWKKRLSGDAGQRVRNTYFFSKANPWRYEKEWRELAERSGVRESSFAVTAIHFGLKCDGAVIQTVVKLLDRNPSVFLYNMYPHKNSFRLKRRSVERDVIESYGLRTPARIEFKDTFFSTTRARCQN